MVYILIGCAGIMFMCFEIFMLIKYRKNIKVLTLKIFFGFIVGVASLLASFTTLIVWRDITIISFITLLVGTFTLIWATDKSKISFDREEKFII